MMEGERPDLGDQLHVVKHPIERITPSLRAPLMSELVLIKIAYELIANARRSSMEATMREVAGDVE
jgi:hypothetical protein